MLGVYIFHTFSAHINISNMLYFNICYVNLLMFLLWYRFGTLYFKVQFSLLSNH